MFAARWPNVFRKLYDYNQIIASRTYKHAHGYTYRYAYKEADGNSYIYALGYTPSADRSSAGNNT